MRRRRRSLKCGKKMCETAGERIENVKRKFGEGLFLVFIKKDCTVYKIKKS